MWSYPSFVAGELAIHEAYTLRSVFVFQFRVAWLVGELVPFIRRFRVSDLLECWPCIMRGSTHGRIDMCFVDVQVIWDDILVSNS